jgi:hypothetical protein
MEKELLFIQEKFLDSIIEEIQNYDSDDLLKLSYFIKESKLIENERLFTLFENKLLETFD